MFSSANVCENVESLGEGGVSVVTGKAELGQTYPILACITQFCHEEPPEVEVELNGRITARMRISDAQQIEALKARAFEPGIFVAKVTAVEPTVEVECQTVVFGKQMSKTV